MLEPIQSGGTRPPLLLVHGQYGISTIGRAVAQAVGAAQPVFALHARGIDGAGEACQTMRALVADHLAAIRNLKFEGPFLIGGVGTGSFVALELARELTVAGRTVGPVLMIDPGPVPHRTAARLKALEPLFAGPVLRRQFHDRALVLFRRWHAENQRLPFDAGDASQLDRAAAVAAATCLALARYRASPFYGPSELILCSHWARNFFVARHDWQKVLPGQRTFHVLEGDHQALLSRHLDAVARLVAIYLESALDPEGTAEPGTRISADAFPDLQ